MDTSPKIKKQKITKGNHKVTVEVENADFRKRKKVTKEIFNTQKWQKPLNSTSQKIDVDFKVTSEASFANSVEMKGVFYFGKSSKGATKNERTCGRVGRGGGGGGGGMGG